MRYIIAVKAKPPARGSDLYMLFGCHDTAAFDATCHEGRA
jgi:hypothetical protein